jgi:multiple sugar transport system permease protein
MDIKRSKTELRNIKTFYILISPWLLGFVLFKLGPMIGSLIFSFTRYSVISPIKFIGFRNITDLFKDRRFLQAVRVTIVYSIVTVPGGLTIALIMALLMNADIKGIRIFRSFFYLPTVVSGVSVAVLWMYIFNPDFGLINTVLGYIGIQGPGWLTSTKWALPSMMIMSLWGVGGAAVIFLAALKNVPRQLYEAANMDGAGVFMRFIKITLPIISPTILFNLIIRIIDALQVFSESFVMTQGGPDGATRFINLYLYVTAFENRRMGYASAMAWFLFIIIMALALLVLKTSKNWVHYESGGTNKNG